MLTQGAAVRFAEKAARWLQVREPADWLTRAIVVTSEEGKRAVVERQEAVALLEKARAKAAHDGLGELAREIVAGMDVVKAAAPIEVPVIIFVEKKDAPPEMGVITLALPTKKPRAR